MSWRTLNEPTPHRMVFRMLPGGAREIRLATDPLVLAQGVAS